MGKEEKNILLKVLVFFIALGLFLFGWSWLSNSREQYVNINTFSECVEAGFPILESYPEQCNTPDGRSFTADVIPDDLIAHIEGKSDLIVLTQPQPLVQITSPLLVKGEARGQWYFEADFPIFLVNWDGLIIAEGVATAILDPNDPESTWMTEDFVPFQAVIEFEDQSWDADFSKRGALILQKDNPSGLSEFDDALEIPVRF